jgi:hypothetical protein
MSEHYSGHDPAAGCGLPLAVLLYALATGLAVLAAWVALPLLGQVVAAFGVLR